LVRSALGVQDARAGVFTHSGSALRAIAPCDLHAHGSHEGVPPDVVGQAHVGEIFVHEWGPPQLQAGVLLRVTQATTGAVLWLDGGCLETVETARQLATDEAQANSNPPKK
jgi:hypothetical protein